MQPIRDMLNQDQPRLWLFYGDSITHGSRHTHGHRDYVQLFEERLRTEMGRPWDVVVRTANSGNTTQQLIGEFDSRAARFKPDVAFLMIGMNDCSDDRDITVEQFEANLHELKCRFDELGSLTVFQTTCPILPGSAPSREPNYDAYMDAVRRVAEHHQAPLIDHTCALGEAGDQIYMWMSNAFHPNEYGHRKFARYLFEHLGIDDPADSKTCQLFIP